MNARTKFFAGAGLVTVTVGYLMAAGIKDTGVYFLMPAELAQRAQTDPSIYGVGVRVGGNVVKGSIERDVASQTITFEVTDGMEVFPVVYHGIAPDTFTDSVEVVVEGRLSREGTLEATNVLAKCGSRYEAVPSADDAAVESMPTTDE
jgi:cytochrome c-type biogenesis protein CcmE